MATLTNCHLLFLFFVVVSDSLFEYMCLCKSVRCVHLVFALVCASNNFFHHPCPKRVCTWVIFSYFVLQNLSMLFFLLLPTLLAPCSAQCISLGPALWSVLLLKLRESILYFKSVKQTVHSTPFLLTPMVQTLQQTYALSEPASQPSVHVVSRARCLRSRKMFFFSILHTFCLKQGKCCV